MNTKLLRYAAAGKAVVSQGFISNIEAGRQTGDGGTLATLSKVLAIKMDELIA